MFSDRILILAKALIDEARSKKLTIATAESCTGGLIAAALTEIPGASDVVECGFVVYSNKSKAKLLGVKLTTIVHHGAVSEEVARAMAEGARAKARSTYALSTTGIAGPSGGSPEKPVGTVYIGLAGPDETVVKSLFFPSDRETFKQLTAQAAFDLLRRKVIAQV